MRRIMKKPTARLLQLFITGLLAALPLAATVAIFAWAISLLVKFLGPNSAVGSVLVAIGLGVTGSEIVGYLLGMGIVAAAIVVLGAVVSTGVQRGLSRWFGSLLRRIPVVRTVYDMVNKLVGLLAQRDEAGMKSMSAVWVHFGGVREGVEGGGPADPGVLVLGLLSSPEAVVVEGGRYLAVVVPTSPVPVGGGLLYVPEAWVRPAAIGVEALTSIYVSLGVTTPQHLGAAAAAVASIPPAAAPAPAPQPAANSSA
jgi:uncharacterized membrane protein